MLKLAVNQFEISRNRMSLHLGLTNPRSERAAEHVNAERAREIAAFARGIDPGDKGGKRDAFGIRFPAQDGPEFFFQRDTRAMAGNREGAFFHSHSLGTAWLKNYPHPELVEG